MSSNQKRRRVNGEGSIFRRKDGRWVGQYEVETLSGPKRMYVYGRSETETIKKRKEAIAKSGSLVSVSATGITVGEYLDYWLENYVKGKVAHRTEDNYRSQVRNHLRPALGHHKLQKLQVWHVQEVYHKKSEEQGLAPASIRSMHAPLSRALNVAKSLELITRNVAESAERPPAHKREMRPLDHRQAQALLSAAEGKRLEALYVLAINTGMRRGELLGLRWQDVDFEAGKLRITHQLQRDRGLGKLVLGKPKNGKSRVIGPGKTAMSALRTHRKNQNEEKLRAGSLYKDEDYVFATERGTPLEESNVAGRDFKPLLAEAGLPNIRFHDLRHTCASLLLARGINAKVVQELLGHSSITVTLDRYSHLLEDMQGTAADAMDDLFGADETG